MGGSLISHDHGREKKIENLKIKKKMIKDCNLRRPQDQVRTDNWCKSTNALPSRRVRAKVCIARGPPRGSDSFQCFIKRE